MEKLREENAILSDRMLREGKETAVGSFMYNANYTTCHKYLAHLRNSKLKKLSAFQN